MANLVETLRTAGAGLNSMPGLKQLLLLISLSASIALGFAVVLWSQEPNFRPLYNNVDNNEMSAMLDALDRAHIKYRLDDSSNMVMVPAGQIYKARIKLAAAGLPKGTGVGFEMLQQDQGITTSRFMETARYRHALEGELGRTISYLDGVVEARVHLAIPTQSSFLENNEKPSASVLVNLGSSQRLEKANVAAISRLVASSIPGLDSYNVTVVDQTGRLLSAEDENDHFTQTKEQFEHKRQFEILLERRIEAIVTPLIGAAKVRAKVSADMDFTHIEQTQENYDQLKPIVRSEETLREQQNNSSISSNGEGGTPGALSATPPVASAAPAGASGQAGASDNGESQSQLSSLRQHTSRKYEVGKTISHTLIPSGVLKRLSIAVVVDNKSIAGSDGKITQQPLTENEIDQITALVKNAVGYFEARGDTLSVVNSSFAPAKIIEPIAPVPFYEQAWVWTVAKTTAGGLFVLLLLLLVLRPVMRSLAERAEDEKKNPPANANNQSAGMSMPMFTGMPHAAMGGHAAPMSGHMPMMNAMPMGHNMNMGMMPNMGQSSGATQSFDAWDQVKNLAAQDPKRMAQVMKDWVRK